MKEIKLIYKDITLPSGKGIIIIERAEWQKFLKKFPTKIVEPKPKEDSQNPFEIFNDIFGKVGFNVASFEVSKKETKKPRKS